MLLRIRSVHPQMVREPQVFEGRSLLVATNTKVFLRDFMTMQEKQILARAAGIQKVNFQRFFGDN